MVTEQIERRIRLGINVHCFKKLAINFFPSQLCDVTLVFKLVSRGHSTYFMRRILNYEVLLFAFVRNFKGIIFTSFWFEGILFTKCRKINGLGSRDQLFSGHFWVGHIFSDINYMGEIQNWLKKSIFL